MIGEDKLVRFSGCPNSQVRLPPTEPFPHAYTDAVPPSPYFHTPPPSHFTHPHSTVPVNLSNTHSHAHALPTRLTPLTHPLRARARAHTLQGASSIVLARRKPP
eukprot:scaffold15913_cov73-Isochrysis_galbana.AAC.1